MNRIFKQFVISSKHWRCFERNTLGCFYYRSLHYFMIWLCWEDRKNWSRIKIWFEGAKRSNDYDRCVTAFLFLQRQKKTTIFGRVEVFFHVFIRVLGFFLSQFRLFSFFIKEELLHSSNSLLSVLDLREVFHNWKYWFWNVVGDVFYYFRVKIRIFWTVDSEWRYHL